MSKLQELIEQYCPDGVEYKTLGELGEMYGGLTGKSKRDFGEGSAFIQYTTVYNNGSVVYDDLGRVAVADNEKQNMIQVGDALITISSENREDCGMTSVVTEEPPETCYLNSFCTGWRPSESSLDPNFLKHLLRSEAVRKQIRKCCSGVTRYNLSKPKLLKVRIPVPPIEVQREVVRLLDAYTAAHDALVQELNEEVKLLQKKTAMLMKISLDECISKATSALPLKELVLAGQKISYGIVQPGEDGTGDMGVIRPVDFDGSSINLEDIKHVDRRKGEGYQRTELNGGEILIVVRGATGAVAVAPSKCRGMNVTRGVAVIRPDESKIPSEFLFDYLLGYKAQKYIEKKTRGTALMQINITDLEKLTVPILTKADFDAYMSNRYQNEQMLRSLAKLKEALQEEERLRQNQLDKFRNQLLSFPEKVA